MKKMPCSSVNCKNDAIIELHLMMLSSKVKDVKYVAHVYACKKHYLGEKETKGSIFFEKPLGK